MMREDQPELQQRPPERWHIGKEVPLTLLAGLVLQTVLFAAFISDLKNEVRITSARVEEIWRDRYTRFDASKDAEISKARDEAAALRIDDHERRLRDIESGRVVANPNGRQR